MDAMHKAYQELRATSRPGNRLHGSGFFQNIKEAVDVAAALEHAGAARRSSAHGVGRGRGTIRCRALGVLYPLAVFLKNGKVSTELLVSEEPLPATT
jgi:hypothetical protein